MSDQETPEVHTTEGTDHPISEGPPPTAPIHEGGTTMSGPTHRMLSSMSTGPEGATSFVLYREDNEPLLSIDLATGKLTKGAEYDPNDAAETFWRAVEAMAPQAPKPQRG